jgi:hypothetical protein
MLLSNARSRTFTCRRSNGWNKPCCFFKQILHTSRSEEMLRQSVINYVIHTQNCKHEHSMQATCFEKFQPLHSLSVQMCWSNWPKMSVNIPKMFQFYKLYCHFYHMQDTLWYETLITSFN